MPYPNGGHTVLGDLAQGITPITAQVNLLLAGGGIAAIAGGLAAWRHWRAVRRPGHFDRLRVDDPCITDALHVAPESIEGTLDHLNNDVPKWLKERVRQLTVRRIENRFEKQMPMFELSWARTNSDEWELEEIKEDGWITKLIAKQPRSSFPLLLPGDVT